MRDVLGRKIDYLRISVTDRCDLRCTYCMPADGVAPKGHDQVLRYEEITRVAEAAVGLGFESIRLTGGEPLVRRGLVGLVERLACLKRRGLKDLSLTTNGTALARWAPELRSAGLDRVNISLDTLSPRRFSNLTRGGRLESALEGIGAALGCGFRPVKLNTVVIVGVNDDEVVDLAHLAALLPVQVRFIELMALGEAQSLALRTVPGEVLRGRLARAGTLRPARPGTGTGAGPARIWSWTPGDGVRPGATVGEAVDRIAAAARLGRAGRGPGEAQAAAAREGASRSSSSPQTLTATGTAGSGIVGFITPLSDHFCGSCNRLRLTADGRLLPCLWSDAALDLKPALRRGAGREEIAGLIRRAAAVKPAAHGRGGPDLAAQRMSQIGG